MTSRLVTLLCACTLAQAADKMIGGPVVVNVGPKSATIVYVMQSGEAKLGTQPDQLTKSAPMLRAERVSFGNLEPGKTYYYDIPGQEGGNGHFKTPPVGPAKFHFVVYGDTRTRHDFHQRVADAISKVEPDFVIHTGDLVVDGVDTAQWPAFFRIERELLKKTVFFPSLGNHERNSRHYYEFFDVQLPYYSFNWGSAHFTVLNSDIGNVGTTAASKEQFWTEQTRWLEEDLAAAQKADMRFVSFHHPPFTAVKRRQGGNKEVQGLVPTFEKFNVTAVFNGHDHNYQHHVKNGIHYIVTGGGGAPLYPVDGPMEITKKVESVEHFVDIKVDGKTARSEAIALDGHIIEVVEFGK